MRRDYAGSPRSERGKNQAFGWPVKPVSENIIEIGYAGCNRVQLRCVEIVEVKHKVDGRINAQNEIDRMCVLPFETLEEVEKVVKDMLKKRGSEERPSLHILELDSSRA